MAVQGTTYTDVAEFFGYPGGPAVDVTNLTVRISEASTGSVIVGPTSTGILHLSTGVYSYPWAISATADLGDYVIVWTADESTASDVIPVTAAPATGTWCSVADVPDICAGQTATAQDVAAAQVIIESAVHRVWRVTDADRRDYVWLKRATAWQSAYVNQHPEILTMMPIQSWSQDGMSFGLAAGTAGFKAYLAPLAIAQLNNLFRGSNTTIRFNSAFQKTRPRGSGYNGTIPWSAQ